MKHRMWTLVLLHRLLPASSTHPTSVSIKLAAADEPFLSPLLISGFPRMIASPGLTS
jgi:hypothetical protein